MIFVNLNKKDDDIPSSFFKIYLDDITTEDCNVITLKDVTKPYILKSIYKSSNNNRQLLTRINSKSEDELYKDIIVYILMTIVSNNKENIDTIFIKPEHSKAMMELFDFIMGQLIEILGVSPVIFEGLNKIKPKDIKDNVIDDYRIYQYLNKI